MKTMLTISILLFSSLGILSAQTKLIAHKSHSGSLSNFSIALENDLFDLSSSDFGMAPMPVIKSARLDSLIFLSDTSAIMITSDICTTGRRKKYDSIWKAGKDTVYFHPLFCFQHKKDSIKKVLDESYNFKNPADSVVMIGYDNRKPIIKPVPIIIKEKETTETIPMNLKPSKKELRKAKRALKREKKKERKAEKEKMKNLEKHPEIKPASFIPINPTPPNDPPGFSFLKILLVSMVAVIAIVFGLYKSKEVIKLQTN